MKWPACLPEQSSSIKSSSCFVERWHASCRWSGVADAFGCACAAEDEEFTEAKVGSEISDLIVAAAESKREVALEAGFHVKD